MSIPRSDAALLLRRAGFGGTPEEVDRLAAAATWADAVERVLAVDADPPVTPPPSLEDDATNDYWRWVDVVQWWVERMRTTPTPIVEKLALFWHNHFTSGTDKVPVYVMWDQVQMYRRMGTGDYHALAQAMAVHPAMLLYLDNATNVASAPQENFARELMELFLMGNGTFTEADVVAMARAWTGHNLQRDVGYVFRATRHDFGSKTLFGVTRAWDGPETITEILRGSQAVTASRFVVAKLWSWFVAPGPAPALVDELAAGFRVDLSIRNLLRAMFLRPEFLAPATRTALLRTPVEWVVALLKALDIPASAAHPEWFLESLGQKLLEPPNVSGWKQNGYWISTSTTWARGRFAGYLRWVATSDEFPYGRLAGLDEDPVDTIVARLVATFGLEEASPATLAVIRDWAAGMKGNWSLQWSIRPNAIPVVALSPDFALA